mgnify:CR=1 FL=1
MNINFVCVRLKDNVESFERRRDAAIDLVRQVAPSENPFYYSDSRVAIYNSNVTDSAWSESPVYRAGATIISFSQPPIPIDIELHNSRAYWDEISNVVASEQYHRLLAGSFGISLQQGNVRVWTDYLGLGRCFYLQNEEFFAASNHLGALTKFATSKLQVDEEALGGFAAVGFYFNDLSPVKGIRHLGKSQLISVDRDGSITKRNYFDLTTLVSPDPEGVSIDETLAELQTVARNTDLLSKETCTVALSGGRDSRMTAAIWLSAGCDADVRTIGTLEGEATIAKELMLRYPEASRSNSVTHRISYPDLKPVSMPFGDRIENAFSLWDGDANPKVLDSAVRFTRPKRVSIGGMGGEICHGYYYLRPGQLEKLAKNVDPLSEIERRFTKRAISDKSREAVSLAVRQTAGEATAHGIHGVERTDYFYLVQKFIRWPRQKTNFASAVFLSSPSFIRASFRIKPKERVEKKLVTDLVAAAIPAWVDVPTYKASSEDLKVYGSAKALSFQKDPEDFWRIFNNADRWQPYFDTSRFEEFIELALADQGLPIHQSWFHTAIWIDETQRHIERLERDRRNL